jgi:hypothetical protein
VDREARGQAVITCARCLQIAAYARTVEPEGLAIVQREHPGDQTAQLEMLTGWALESFKNLATAIEQHAVEHLGAAAKVEIV